MSELYLYLSTIDNKYSLVAFIILILVCVFKKPITEYLRAKTENLRTNNQLSADLINDLRVKSANDSQWKDKHIERLEKENEEIRAKT